MAEPSNVPCDLPCAECGYNLRTLAIDGNCPECNCPVAKSIQLVPPDAPDELQDLKFVLKRRPFESIAHAADCTVDAVMIVMDAFRRAQAVYGGRAFLTRDFVKRHVTARQVCEALRDHAMAYFNDEAEAKELLAEWGIWRSEDVGRIIFAMVDSGQFGAQEGESVHDFDGLFTLDTLFAPGSP
jgi:uncharacterized repeat protein (TIGR04138 family)